MRFIFYLILIFPVDSFAQVTQQWAFVFTWGNYYDSPTDIALDLQGNVYVCGDTYSGSSSATYNAVTLKYSPTGTILWSVIYNGPANNADGGRAVAVDNSGNVYVAGYATVSGTTPDVLLIKYNSSGVQQWLQTYNGAGNGSDGASSIAIDASGFIYVAGGATGAGTNYDFAVLKYNASGVLQWASFYNGTGNGSDYLYGISIGASGDIFVTGPSLGAGSQSDYATVKYNSSGVQQWVQRYNGPGNSYDYANAIVTDAGNNVYVTGSSYGAGTGSDIATIKYNSSGVQQWLQRYDGTAVNLDAAYAIALDSSGNIIAAGYSSGVGSNYDYITLKYSAAGSQLWEARFNGPGNGLDIILAVAVDNMNSVYVTGQSDVNNFVYADVTTIKYNSSGVQQWSIRYNGSGNSSDQGRAITLDASYNVYVTALAWGTSATNWDIATIKYSQVVGITPVSNETPSVFNLYQNYPNPFNPVTKIRFDIPPSKGVGAMTKLTVYDILGSELTTLLNKQLKPDTYEVEWDASNYPSGIYFYRLTAGDYTASKKMILLK